MNETAKDARSRIEKRKKRRQRELARNLLICCGILCIFLIVIIVVTNHAKSRETVKEAEKQKEIVNRKYIENAPDYSVQLLPINEYSRPGKALEQVNGVVIHYTGNPGTTAQQNHDYFEGLAETGETSASSHFIVGMDGEIIQCVPCQEIAYASNERNADTISIEVCIADDTGIFSENAKKSLIHLTTWLMGRYDLEIDDIIRHYDVTGKQCPKYYVEHPLAWDALKDEMVKYIDKNGVLSLVQ